MGGKPRIYSVAEANALLPQIAQLVDRQTECVIAIERTVAAWRALSGETAERVDAGHALPDLKADPADALPVATIKQALRGWIVVLRETWSAIESTGAVLRDSRAGLVHFEAEHERERVWLCWKRGEPEVAYFHRQDECPATRRPLTGAPTSGSTPAGVLN